MNPTATPIITYSNPLGSSPSRSRPPGSLPGVGTFDCAEDGLDSAGDAARQISTSKTRHNFLSNNVSGTEICQGAFETIAHFDSNFSFAQGDEQQHAVISTLVAELPGGADPMRERFERFAFERWQNQDGNLIVGFLLVGFEVVGERGGDIGRKYMRKIHDAACEWRHVKRPG